MSNEVTIAGDIGGTNATFALVDGGKGKPRILFKHRFDTQGLSFFPDVVNEFNKMLRQKNMGIPERACFAIAGPVSGNKGILTHASFDVDASELLEQTNLTEVLVINDFDAIGFAIPLLDVKDLITIKKGTAEKNGRIGVIGAGTGLGKSLLAWDEHNKAYFPIPSETGHADLVVHTQEEQEFVEFTKKQLDIREPASWEMVLSGQGLVNVYSYLCQKRKKAIPKNISAEIISSTRKTDHLSKEAFTWFERFYARLAKNATLEYVATGGIYIAGGIVAKNQDMFTENFLKEYKDNLRLREILEHCPVHAITNYDISLLGCVNASIVWKERISKKK